MAEEAEKKYQNKNDFAPEEKMLVTLRNELYFGSWEKMRQDLKDRLKDRPYIFKLQNRIKEDLERIDTLESYELKNKVNLADLIKKEESSKS